MSLRNKNAAALRKIAEEQKIKGWENMTRQELLKALSTPKEKPAEKPQKLSEEETPKADSKDEEEELEPPSEDEPEEEPEKEPAGPEITPESKIIVGFRGSRVAQGSKAARMKDKLDHQTKVEILIPLEGDKFGTTYPVTLNGYRMNILKGLYVSVPRQIADVVRNAQRQTLEALEGPRRRDGSSMKFDGVGPAELR